MVLVQLYMSPYGKAARKATHRQERESFLTAGQLQQSIDILFLRLFTPR